MTELVLVRHGQTVWHAENRYAGSSDVDLTAAGVRQADALGAWAATAGLDAVWCSPLSRARKTADACTGTTGLEAHVDPRLTEAHFGRGEGLTSQEMEREFPEARAAFVHDPVAHPLPGGEPLDAVASRFVAALDDAARAHPDGTVLVVAHSTAIRLALCRLTGIPLRDYRRVLPSLGNVALTRVRPRDDGPAALLELNRPLEPKVSQP
ncbi:histidine phosphatase family protein [Solicola sp. PLA-1-18]|uniref:histidine phosphatase family protein n=1 Tax=Solicola sp. PLA-1-18 TaxID=3380532 RepID=UPI003B7EF034